VRAGDLKAGWVDLGVVLVTNNHVLAAHPETDNTLSLEQAQVELQALTMEGASQASIPVNEVVWSSRPDELDATVVQVVEPTGEVDPCPITPFRPRLDGKQRVYVVGHPEGRELSYSIDDNVLLDYDDRFIHYRAPTEPGSSGSPVFNRDWEVIGLHHAGRSDMRRLHGQSGTYPANEGIWIEAIREAISTKT
jgi:S1-C subfamily serine protease